MIAGESLKCYDNKYPLGESDDKSEKSSNNDNKTVIPPSNTWSLCESTVFHLRIGPDYKKNGLKGPSNASLYNIVGIDVVKTPKRIDNFGSKVSLPAEWKSIRCNRPGVPPIFIVNFQMPSEFPTTIFKTITDGPGWSILFYLQMSQSTCDALNGTTACSNGIYLFNNISYVFIMIIIIISH